MLQCLQCTFHSWAVDGAVCFLTHLSLICSGHENIHILVCFWPALDFSGIKERTLVAVKPDGVQRRLIGDVIKRFEQRGFRLVGLKMLQVSDSHRRGSWLCDVFVHHVSVYFSGFWQAFSSALCLTAEETLLRQPALLHDLWPRSCHGEELCFSVTTYYEYHTTIILILFLQYAKKSAKPTAFD